MAAGYVIYGSSTMMVYHGPGARMGSRSIRRSASSCSHPNIKIPTRTLSPSTTHTNALWDDNVRKVMRKYKGLDGDHRALSTRYVGSLVADFHRNLLGGGIFAYPANTRSTKGKLRLLYEANPLAFIVEQAGGAATDGTQNICDVQPTELHQRTPLYIGSKKEVELAQRILAGQPELVVA